VPIFQNYNKSQRLVHFILSRVFLTILISNFCLVIKAQNCPPNIDFENGNFDGWTCYIGNTTANGNQNQINLTNSGPVNGRHTMLSSYPPGDGNDPYGGFPMNCPNGSGHSIRLGNDLGGGEAEGISYDFVIPAGQNNYSLIYYYAVVFQDPNHLEFQQPRMVIEITNVTDDILIGCSSFTFIPYGNILPGFFESANPGSGTPVWCKDWSAVSINLDNMAGKTIRLFFKTGDCTFQRHFGYAYIDVNSECGGDFVGATFCPDDTLIHVTAPYGYQNYTWWNSTFTTVLGSQQTITFSPPPPPGTTIAVEVVPYNGYGCLDTLIARLMDTLTVTANAGVDKLSCNSNPVQLGELPRAGLVYQWTPAVGLSNATISNPFSSPAATTTYYLKVSHDGGGCADRDTVLVTASIINNALQLLGKATYCVGSGDSAVLMVQPDERIEWYKNNSLLTINQVRLPITQTGSYYATIYNIDGCNIKTATQDILVDRPKPGITYPVEYALENAPLILQARQFGSSAFWSPAISLDDPASFSPVFKGLYDQLYTITIKTTTGCTTVDTQQVKTIKSVEIFVPTAFTPNHDGLNDFLKPVLIGVKQLRYFRIYNRWGQVIFESTRASPGWDGTLSGIPQSSQLYVWIAEGIGVDGRVYSRKGSTVLIR
jgi:gliding motility-associated-like protein